jgi:hypothetical protein
MAAVARPYDLDQRSAPATTARVVKEENPE